MTPADVMIATFDAGGAAEAMRVAGQLREQGLRVLVYPDADKIGKQIKYADGRGIPYVALLGEDEIRDRTLTIKDLKAQSQERVPQAEAGVKIREALKRRG
jgi:histidyl-tRNA synthetase